MTDDLAPVSPDQLRITVEVGDDHDLSPEVAEALAALADALGTDEVSGFATRPVRSFAYDSGGLGLGIPTRGTFHKGSGVDNIKFDGVDGIAGGDLGSGR